MNLLDIFVDELRKVAWVTAAATAARYAAPTVTKYLAPVAKDVAISTGANLATSAAEKAGRQVSSFPAQQRRPPAATGVPQGSMPTAGSRIGGPPAR
jgi:hypothetical protein